MRYFNSIDIVEHSVFSAVPSASFLEISPGVLRAPPEVAFAKRICEFFLSRIVSDFLLLILFLGEHPSFLGLLRFFIHLKMYLFFFSINMYFTKSSFMIVFFFPFNLSVFVFLL